LALERRYAINIGGGFHHACSNDGGGFCLYADITLAIKYLLISGLIERAMIVDLDAHQGNGHERDFLWDNRVYIMDMFNYEIYPGDFSAKRKLFIQEWMTISFFRSHSQMRSSEQLYRRRRIFEQIAKEFAGSFKRIQA
jgi:acetoin utilization deacetylase AcuC-like enzyme